jgi:small subunit ribosomal protein S9
MAEDERPDSPEEETNLAGSGAAGEPSEAAGDAETPPAADAQPEEAPAAEAEQPAAEPEAPAAEPEAPAAEAEQPAAEPEAPAAEAEQPAAEPAAEPEAPAAEAEQPSAQPEAPAADAEQPAAEPAAPAAESEQPAEGEERPQRRREAESTAATPDVVPGAHLEPDLVLDADRREGEDDEFARYADDGDSEAAAGVEEQPAPAPRSTIDLAADARYKATGKRKTAIARVIVRPGSGVYQINGRTLDEFFPRLTLQRTARMPLETAGYETRMDVIARIQGGGVSAQAGALRHGIARALVEADPNLRTELKRRGFLTRDAREKERKKAGLKKARKRPQFSKR